MKQRRFDQFTQIFLVNASQMAYLEEAHGTQTMLLKFNELFRYCIKVDAGSFLSEEIKALLNYIDIQKTIFGNRFNITVENFDTFDDILIGHLTIIDFFESILNSALEKYEEPISFFVQIIQKECKGLRVVLRTDGIKEEFFKALEEEASHV